MRHKKKNQPRAFLGITLAFLLIPLLFAACGSVSDISTTSDTCVIGQDNDSRSGTSGLNTGIFRTLGMTFEPNTTTAFSTVDLALVRTGTPAGTLTLAVQGDSSGAPDGVDLATGTFTIATGAVNHIDTAAAYYTFTLSTSLSLALDTTYWLVLSASYGVNAVSYISWVNKSPSNYSLGASYYTDAAAAWTSIANTDFLFRSGCGS